MSVASLVPEQVLPAARSRRGSAVTFSVVVLSALVITASTHDLGYLASWPLSGDESWVVVAKLFPIGDLPTLSSSAPVGFNLLVQMFGVFGLTGGRWLVELFTAGSLVAAFYAGRIVPVRPRGASPLVTGIVAAVAVALTPATLIRVDVKSYSADAFVTLLILFLMLRVIATGSRATFAWLTAVSAVGLLIAFGTLFAASAAFVSLLIQTLITGAGRARVVIGGAIAAGGITSCYALFSAHGDIPALRKFWSYEYPPSILALPHFVVSRMLQVDNLTAFSTIAVIVPLVVLLIVVAARRRAWAFAAFLPAMFLVMVGLGLARRYPLLDGRTSNFFIIAVSFFAGISAFWLVAVTLRRLRPRPGTAGVLGQRSVAFAIGTVTLALLGLAVPFLRAHPLPPYDTSHQAAYVESHLGPHDLVLFNNLASYQVALTWKLDRPSWCPDQSSWTGYYICYPNSTRIRGFGPLSQAYHLIDAHLGEFPGSRVWLIRSNVFTDYEPMEKYLFLHYRYQVINLPIQPAGVVTGVL